MAIWGFLFAQNPVLVANLFLLKCYMDHRRTSFQRETERSFTATNINTCRQKSKVKPLSDDLGVSNGWRGAAVSRQLVAAAEDGAAGVLRAGTREELGVVEDVLLLTSVAGS